jgi:hypothetical protein
MVCSSHHKYGFTAADRKAWFERLQFFHGRDCKVDEARVSFGSESNTRSGVTLADIPAWVEAKLASAGEAQAKSAEIVVDFGRKWIGVAHAGVFPAIPDSYHKAEAAIKRWRELEKEPRFAAMQQTCTKIWKVIVSCKESGREVFVSESLDWKDVAIEVDRQEWVKYLARALITSQLVTQAFCEEIPRRSSRKRKAGSQEENAPSNKAESVAPPAAASTTTAATTATAAAAVATTAPAAYPATTAAAVVRSLTPMRYYFLTPVTSGVVELDEAGIRMSSDIDFDLDDGFCGNYTTNSERNRAYWGPWLAAQRPAASPIPPLSD